ncbi:MAG: hypothetical protein QY318_00765 [Candidatus Dojkabacteria bacterium]|nr:MAG: hypothetical protein QY318_00765 [Candidatus Dojkabacteria bacterium]
MHKLKGERYQGQALAIILIVLVVAVIIALAILSRTLKDSRRVVDEQESAESVEIADTTLDALKDITLEEFALFAETAGVEAGICNPGGTIPNYDFYEHGCEISSEDIDVLIDYFGDGYDLEAIFSTIFSDLSNQCHEETSGFRIMFEPANAEEEFEIGKDTMFAFVPGAIPAPAGCQVEINASPVGSPDGRLIVANIYAQRDGAGLISSYKEYAYDDVKGYCFTAGCGPQYWTPATGTPSIVVPASMASGGQTYYINEIRMRAVNSTVAVSAIADPNECVNIGTYMKISAIVNCGDNSRGKELVVSDQEWAPQIFDYVLFNGEGELRTYDE